MSGRECDFGLALHCCEDLQEPLSRWQTAPSSWRGSVQAALAVGLLQLRPWKPRFVGLLGVVASAINCYMLLPPVAKPAAKPAAKPEPAGLPARPEPALKTA